MEQQTVAPVKIYEHQNDVVVNDIAMSTVVVRIAHHFMEMLESESNSLSSTLKTAAYRVKREAVEFERKAVIALSATHPELRKEIEKDKIHDIAVILDLLMGMGRGQKAEEYEEFLSMMLDLVKSITYAQIKGKNLHFGKYRALFTLIRDEMKFDVDELPSQFDFVQGKLYPKFFTPAIREEITCER